MFRHRLVVLGVLAASSFVVPLAVRTGSAALPVVQTFHGLTPARLLDTRVDGSTIDDAYVAGGALGAQATVDIAVTGRGGVPISGVGSVALNITAVNPTAPSYVTAYATGAAQPTASNLNVTAGQIVANMAIVAVGKDGQIRLYNNGGSVDLVVDVLGWFPDGSSYTGLTPARLLDTRAGQSTIDGQFLTGTPVVGGTSLDLLVGGRGNVPTSGVGSVALNVTVAGATSNGYVTVYPTGATRPTASNLNFTPGQVVPNMVIVPLGTDGRVSLYNSSGQTDLAVDVLGWFPTGSSYTGLTPARLLDTRSGQPTIDSQFSGGDAVGPAGTLDLTVIGRGGVPPSGVGAVALNVTATNPTADSYVTVWPTGADRPTASNINVTPRATVPNMVMVKLGTDGKVSLFNNGGNTDLIVDVLGWFPLDKASGGGGSTTTTAPGSPTTTTMPPLVQGPTSLVSAPAPLVVGHVGASTNAMIAAGGRYVVFTSDATNLVSNDTNNKSDVFERDTANGTTKRVSLTNGDAQADGDSDSASISGDGRYVAFRSDATNLIGAGNDTNGFGDVFVRDTVSNTTVMISENFAGTTQASAEATAPAISGDGAWVAWSTADTALLGGAGGGHKRIAVRSRLSSGGGFWVAGMPMLGVPNGDSTDPSLAFDGHRVAYTSTASNLVPSDSNGVSDVFIHDRVATANTRISVRDGGAQAPKASSKPSIAGDGDDIAFQSDAVLFSDDINLVTDIYVYDVPSADIILVSVVGNSTPNGPSVTPALSLDGTTVAFASDASNLVANDGNGVRDIFVGSIVGVPIYRGSQTTAGGGLDAASHNASISANGRYLVFDSTADNVGSDANVTSDVFIHDTVQS